MRKDFLPSYSREDVDSFWDWAKDYYEDLDEECVRRLFEVGDLTEEEMKKIQN